MVRSGLFCALILWVVLFDAALVSACPNCKDGLLENGQSGLALARGFELSIYLMLAAPALILTTLATVFYFQIKRAKQAGQYPDMDTVIAQAESAASVR